MNAAGMPPVNSLTMKRALLLLIGAGLLSTGCAIQIGNRHPDASGGTLGQQLVDLKKAKDAGVISDAEYETKRKKLLDEDDG
jgi:hypothetical protein